MSWAGIDLKKCASSKTAQEKTVNFPGKEDDSVTLVVCVTLKNVPVF
jgi:hypothetical protein